jgi:hypothetical protein
MAVGTVAAAIITDGTGVAVITNGVTIDSLFAIPLPGRHANFSGANGSRRQRRGRFCG